MKFQMIIMAHSDKFVLLCTAHVLRLKQSSGTKNQRFVLNLKMLSVAITVMFPCFWQAESVAAFCIK